MNSPDIAKIAAIVLAAGGSTRSKEPKQQLLFRGRELLSHSVQVAVGSVCEPVCVVLGARADQFRSRIEDLNVTITINNSWESGISSSITTGIQKVLEIDNEVDAVLITAIDQPLVTSKMLDDLVELYSDGRTRIVACSYNGTVGIPALFDRSLFRVLESLEGDRGAKRVILENISDAVHIECPEAGIDIDSEEDLARLEAE